MKNATAQSLQARWFIPLEMRVISGKKEALQAFSISKNVAWNSLTFRFEEIEKSINSTRDTPMNQRIKPSQLCVAFWSAQKARNSCTGYFCLPEERRSWKSAQHCIASAANRSFSGDSMLSVSSPGGAIRIS